MSVTTAKDKALSQKMLEVEKAASVNTFVEPRGPIPRVPHALNPPSERLFQFRIAQMKKAHTDVRDYQSGVARVMNVPGSGDRKAKGG